VIVLACPGGSSHAHDPAGDATRGGYENNNSLLRQCFPKGTDLSVHDQTHFDTVARELHGRPRQTLGRMKPSEALDMIVARTIETAILRR
jgi:IS30 family transposase